MKTYCREPGCIQDAYAGVYCREHGAVPATPLDTQVGGDHYMKMKIQPVEYIYANAIPFLDGNVVKYISRHRSKNGAADVRKAIHYCQMILRMEYGEDE